MKFTIIKSCLARFSGIFAVGTPSNIHGTAISYRCAKFGAFVNSVTILTLRDLTNKSRVWYLAYVQAIPESFCAGTKTIPDRASVQKQKRSWRRDFRDGAKLLRTDL